MSKAYNYFVNEAQYQYPKWLLLYLEYDASPRCCGVFVGQQVLRQKLYNTFVLPFFAHVVTTFYPSLDQKLHQVILTTAEVPSVYTSLLYLSFPLLFLISLFYIAVVAKLISKDSSTFVIQLFQCLTNTLLSILITHGQWHCKRDSFIHNNEF